MSAFDPACIDTLDMLECLEIRNVQMATDREVKFSCPFPGHSTGDESPSAYMNIATTAFFCHGCHEKGNAIHFACKVLGVSHLEAIRMLKARYSPSGINPEAVNMVSEVQKILSREPDVAEPQPVLDADTVDRFAVDWFKVSETDTALVPEPFRYIMYGRGFTAKTLDEWQFGYDESSDRIVFPVYDDQGTLVGFKGRSWRSAHKPKYLVLGDRPGRPERYGWKCFHTGKIVFGLHKVVAKAGPVEMIICEGELNAIAMHQHGFPTAVAVNGSNFSQVQAKLIRRYADSAVVFFDSDAAGADGTELVVAALKDFMPVRVVDEHEDDPASMSSRQVEECVSGAQTCTMLNISVRS